MLPTIVPSVFEGRGKEGDFDWMINRSEYADALFIFNDNVEQHRRARRGGGNAIVAWYSKYGNYSKYPRSAGIPTGYSPAKGGFVALTPAVKKIIDNSVDEIRALIDTHHYARIFFSADEDGELASAIFDISDPVRTYITDKIYDLGGPTEED